MTKNNKHSNETKSSSPFFDSSYWYSFAFSLLLAILAVFIQNETSKYNDIINSNIPVGDMAFAFIPIVDLSPLFFTGGFVVLLGGIIYGFYKNPKIIPFGIFAFALFILFRSFCISLTHLGVPPDHIIPSGSGAGIINFFQNDLFFSGHTGSPFLLALIAWQHKLWRYMFLGTSVLMAYTVIAMRLHYSIDIVGAYFITYGVFHIAQSLWNIIPFAYPMSPKTSSPV